MTRLLALIPMSGMLGAAILFIGCASAGPSEQSGDYSTSGSAQADQRAEQRMAQAQQLSGQGQSSNNASATQSDTKSLYDRLGGEDELIKIVDDFVDRAMADPRVNWTRKGIIQGGLSIHHDRSMEWDASPQNVKLLKWHLVQFLAVASGGPSQYSGQPIQAAHQDMHISNAEFDACVGDLKATLDKFQIAPPEQRELLAIIETTRPQIVEEE
jgi:hemoglobin